MSQSQVVSILMRMLTVTLEMSAPVLLIAVAVGILVSIFQAVTQINDTTLTLVPKILSVFAALALFGPWMFHQLMQFTVQMLSQPGGVP